jgi:branched-chain amino acid transport system substrate-binding protein
MKKDFWEQYSKEVPQAQSVGELWPKLGTIDFTPYIPTIMASGADGVFTCIYGGDEMNLVKQALPYGMYEKMHVISAGSSDIDVWAGTKQGDRAPVGALSATRCAFWAIDNPQSKSLVEKYRKQFGGPATIGVMSQYVTIYALKER